MTDEHSRGNNQNYTQVVNLKEVIWLAWFACPFLFLSN